MVKNALTINAYENRQISASVIRVSLFDAQSDFTSLFVAIITILLSRTERNEIPNAEGVKQVFSPTRPTLFHVAHVAFCSIFFSAFLFGSCRCSSHQKAIVPLFSFDL